MAENANTKTVTIGFPGGDYGNERDQLPVVTSAMETAYRIPPVIWMIVFLVVGYIGVRWVMED